LGKIAVELGSACAQREWRGAQPGLRAQRLAAGEDWLVEDVLCTYRPNDPPFEERHEDYRVALVGAGTFVCRTAQGFELLTPGSLLLGNRSEHFECSHAHGTGDRCLAFAYSPALFERVAHDAGVRGKPRLRGLRLPPLEPLAVLVAETTAAWVGAELGAVWAELGTRMAAAAARFAAEPTYLPRAPLNAERGVTRAVRLIERDPSALLALDALAQEARLSRFHFLRAFARVTGLTPHRYVRRARLRRAAVQLATSNERVVEIALASGFRDLSNFNHAFRAEFGSTPRAYRVQQRRGGPGR
jgi:AraC family transcriptional regulator